MTRGTLTFMPGLQKFEWIESSLHAPPPLRHPKHIPPTRISKNLSCLMHSFCVREKSLIWKWEGWVCAFGFPAYQATPPSPFPFFFNPPSFLTAFFSDCTNLLPVPYFTQPIFWFLSLSNFNIQSNFAPSSLSSPTSFLFPPTCVKNTDTGLFWGILNTHR